MTGPSTDLLTALLGPGEPELTCEECFDLLHRYVELNCTKIGLLSTALAEDEVRTIMRAELTGADADRAVPGMRAHLGGCPACRDDHESLRELVADDQATV